MIINNNRLLTTLSIILALIITSLMVPPSVAQANSDFWYPDFEGLGSGINGFPLPLVGTPIIGKSRADLGIDTTKSITFNYARGAESSLQEISLYIQWHYKKTYMKEPLTDRIMRQISYGKKPNWLGVDNAILYFTLLSQDPNVRVLIAEPDLSHPASYVQMQSHFLAFYQIAGYRIDEFRTGYWGKRVLLYRDHYVIIIEGKGPGWKSNQEFLNAFSQLEQYAKTAVDMVNVEVLAGNLSFVYYDPFTTPSGGQYNPGDLVATLKDSNGRGMSGKQIFFFKRDQRTSGDSRFNEVLKFNQTYEIKGFEQGATDFLYFSDDCYFNYTESGPGLFKRLGEVSFNYVDWGAIDYPKLLEYLNSYGKVSGTIYAVVFDKDPRLTYHPLDIPRIENIAQIDIEFKGIAAIIRTGKADSLKSSEISFMPSGKDDKIPFYGNPPFYLQEGKIFFDTNSILTIKWLNGMEMAYRVKEGFENAGEQEIKIKYVDAGWYRWFDRKVGNTFVQMGISATPTIVGMYLGGKAGALIGGPISLGIGGIIFLYEGAKYMWDPVAVVPRSQILFDFDDEISVYTIDGTAQIYKTKTGEMIEVGTGKMVTLSSPGDFGKVTGFSESKLSPDLLLMKELLPPPDQSPAGGDVPGSSGLITSVPPIADITYGGSTQSSSSTGIIIALASGVFVLGLVVFGLNRRRRTTARSMEAVVEIEAPVSTPLPVPPSAPANITENRIAQDTVQPGIKCPSCGALASAGARFCQMCAAPLQTEPYTQKQVAWAASQNDIRCPNCGAVSSTEAKFCRQCAAQLQAQTQTANTMSNERFCPRCGAARRADKPFCSSCGNRFRN